MNSTLRIHWRLVALYRSSSIGSLVLCITIAWTLCFDRSFGQDSMPHQPPSAIKALVASIRHEEADRYGIAWEEPNATPHRDLPIGIFDSGIGGLTVLETILEYDEHNNQTGQPGKDGRPDFEGETFLYLGDQANMPYGNYASAGKEELLRELIVRDAAFLLGTRYKQIDAPALTYHDKPSVKAIVIACNTATAYGLDDVRWALKEWGKEIPVVGVVEAGAFSLVQELPNQGATGAVAVMATSGTCSSNAYPKAIAKIAGQAGKRQPIVWQQGSVGLAGAIEGNRSFVENREQVRRETYQGPSLKNSKAPLKEELSDVYAFDPEGIIGNPSDPSSWELNSVENYVRYDIVSMVDGYRLSGAKSPIDRVILGCTHFPFESDRIRANLERLRTWKAPDGTTPYRDVLSPNIQLIDPGALTAQQLFRTLFRNKIRTSRPDREGKAVPSIHSMYLSVPNPNRGGQFWKHEKEAIEFPIIADNGFTSEYKYGRTAKEIAMEDYWVIPLTHRELPTSLHPLLSTHCDSVWTHLQPPPRP